MEFLFGFNLFESCLENSCGLALFDSILAEVRILATLNMIDSNFSFFNNLFFNDHHETNRILEYIIFVLSHIKFSLVDYELP